MPGLGEHLQMLKTISREVVNTRGRLVPSTNKEVDGPADDKAGWSPAPIAVRSQFKKHSPMIQAA